jgi:5-methylthioadenosine/S-adenosylhomocysteine deaminase
MPTRTNREPRRALPRLVIANIDYLVTVDPQRRIIRNGALVIEGGRIAAVGKSADYPAITGDEVIDARGKLALPGVFDTHVHNAQQLGRSCGDEAYSGPERLFRRLWPVEAHMDKDDALCAARLAQVEMIRAGTTCFADPGSYFTAETAQAVKESGMRGMIARTVFDMGQTTMGNLPPGFFEPTDEAIARADEMVAAFDGALDGRLKAWFSIRVPVALSDELLRRLGKFAEKRGVGIIGHACENRDETVASHLKYGIGDIARLEKLGLLGPNMLLLHMGWVDAKELHMLQKRDVKIRAVRLDASGHGQYQLRQNAGNAGARAIAFARIGFSHVVELSRRHPAGLSHCRRPARGAPRSQGAAPGNRGRDAHHQRRALHAVG